MNNDLITIDSDTLRNVSGGALMSTEPRGSLEPTTYSPNVTRSGGQGSLEGSLGGKGLGGSAAASGGGGTETARSNYGHCLDTLKDMGGKPPDIQQCNAAL